MQYKYKLSEQPKRDILKPKDVSPALLKRLEDLYGPIDTERDFFSGNLDTYFKTNKIDKETGTVGHKVIRLASFEESLRQITDAFESLKDLLKSDEAKNDSNIQDVAKDIKDALNKYRAHLRKFYPEQYRQAMSRMNEGEVDEISTSAGAGSYLTKYAFRKPKKKQKDIMPEIDEGTCGYDRDKNGKKLKGPGGLGEAIDLVHVYDKDGSIFGTGEIIQKLPNDKVKVRFDGNFMGTFRADRVKPIQEGDTYEKMAAKGKKAGNLKQGTVRKRLGIKKGEKIPLSLINKEISRLKKMDKDKDKAGVQLGDKNQKYYKALQLSKTLKTTTNVNEVVKVGDILTKDGRKGKVVKVMDDMANVDFGNGDVYGITFRRIKGNKIVNENSKNPGATLGPGPKAGPDGVIDNYYTKAFKYKLVPKKKGTYVQKGSGLEVKKLF